MKDRIVHRYIKHLSDEKIRDATDIEYLFDVVTKDKVLDIARIQESGIPLWIKVMDLDTREIKYLNIANHDPIALLKASASMVPYTHTLVVLNGRKYVDASIVEQIGFAELRKRHPTSKIVVVFSGDINSSLANVLKNHIEGYFAGIMYGPEYRKLFATAYVRLQDDLRMIRSDPRALLIEAPQESPTLTRTQDPEKILATYQMGIEAGKRISAFLAQ